MESSNGTSTLEEREEEFCRLYSEAFWGRPREAAKAAGFENPDLKAVVLMRKKNVRERIRELRCGISEQSIADSAWIKEALVEIAMNAEKTNVRLRALTSLHKIAADENNAKKRQTACEFEQPQLPFFDGGSE